MAAGDIWVCTYPYNYVSDVLVESYDVNAQKVFTQTIHVSDYSYVADQIHKPLILAKEDLVLCVLGASIYVKFAEDAGFTLAQHLIDVDTVHAAEPLHLAYQEGIYTLCIYLGYYTSFPTYKSYSKYYESTDGLVWVEKISNEYSFSLLNVIPINFAYIAPNTNRRYFLSALELLDIGIEGGFFYTDDFNTFTSVLSYSDINSYFGNEDWQFTDKSPLVYDGNLYLLMGDLEERYFPVVAKVSLSAHTTTYLPFESGGYSIDIDFYALAYDAVRSLPDRTPFVLLYENDYSTCGLYKLNTLATAFVRYDILSGNTYWPPGNNNIRLDNRAISLGETAMTACGGSSGELSTESYEAVFLYDNLRITIPPYSLDGSYYPWLYITVEGGIAIEGEFWTEEDQCVEATYEY